MFENITHFTKQLLEFDINPVNIDRRKAILYLEKIKTNAKNKYVTFKMYKVAFNKLMKYFMYENRYEKNMLKMLKRNIIRCRRMIHTLALFETTINTHIYNLTQKIIFYFLSMLLFFSFMNLEIFTTDFYEIRENTISNIDLMINNCECKNENQISTLIHTIKVNWQTFKNEVKQSLNNKHTYLQNDDYVRSILKNTIIYNVIKQEVENDYISAEKNLEISMKYKQVCEKLREIFKTNTPCNLIFAKSTRELFLNVNDLNVSLINLKNTLLYAKNNIAVE